MFGFSYFYFLDNSFIVNCYCIVLCYEENTVFSVGMNKVVHIVLYRIISYRILSYRMVSPLLLPLLHSALWETICVQLLCVRTGQMVLKQENIGDKSQF